MAEGGGSTGNARHAEGPAMAWTVLMAGLALVAFAMIIIVFGSKAQQSFILPVLGFGSIFVSWGMGIKVNAIQLIRPLLGAGGT